MELKLIEELAGVMARTALAEIGYAKDGLRIRLQRGAVVRQGPRGASGSDLRDSPPVSAATPATAPATSAAGHCVLAGMRGTFYGAPAPGEAPFVKVGDWVQEGQVLAVVEAMKMLNQIESDVAGRIVRIAVEDGTAVTPTTVLFEIDSQGADRD